MEIRALSSLRPSCRQCGTTVKELTCQHLPDESLYLLSALCHGDRHIEPVEAHQIDEAIVSLATNNHTAF